MNGTVWSRRFKSRKPNAVLDALNSSIREDAFLYDAEIRASAAYARGLRRARVLSETELLRILRGLAAVKKKIEGGLTLAAFEDIHSAVELLLIDEIGDAGKKLHTGRSRNEQVVTDERLYLKKKIPNVLRLIKDIQRELVRLAESHSDAVMPGYTHLQRGQVLLFAHYILSFFWALERGKDRLRETLKRTDVLPLGSGALAGSTAALDRGYLKSLLGFGSVSLNSYDAVGDRSFILETIFALALVFLDLSRMAEDVIIFSSAEFGFLRLDDSLTTSSSLMPQKKNPDIFELIRAAPGRMFGHLSRMFLVLKGIPSSYNKDLQDDKEPLRRSLEDADAVLAATKTALERIRPDCDKMRENMDSGLFATDFADYLTEKGLPFREAHGLAGEIIRYAESRKQGLDSLTLDELRSFDPAFDEDILGIFNPFRSIRRKKTEGSTHPDEVRVQIKKAKRLVK